MDYLVGFVVGIVLYYLFDRIIMKAVRKRMGFESSVRREFLDKMGFDSLVSLDTAVQNELARRKQSVK